MGNNTVALFLNDQYDALTHKGQQVLNTLSECMRSGRGTDYLGGPAQMQVLPSAHADTLQIIAAGGNSIQIIGYAHWTDRTPEQVLRKLADQHGFRLVRKSRP